MSVYETPYDPSTAPKNLETVIYEKEGHVAIITHNRPAARNSMSHQLHLDLYACWKDAKLDPNVWVAIVTGKGEAFCAGRDVKELAAYQKMGKRIPRNDPSSPYYNLRGFPENVNFQKPVIAALNGYACGGGLHYVMQCDLRVMADDAWLGDQHTNIGQLGSPDILYRAMPRVWAAYTMLCNGRLTAEMCFQFGIVNKVVPKEQVLAEAKKLADMIVAASPVACQAAKRLYNHIWRRDPVLDDLGDQLDIMCRESEDGAEGPRAFAEKRKPVWKNR